MKKSILIIFFILNVFQAYPNENITYKLTNYPIDVVIPAHEKDLRTINMAIKGIRSFGKNIRRIIVVSEKRYTDQAEWFDEAKYPFSKKDVLEVIINDVLKGKQIDVPRLGWIYQQFLKLYAPLIIPDISSNVLMLDADTIFLNPVEFIDDNGNALYNVGTEYHHPYFYHAAKLIKDKPISKIFPNFSGICHHMLFQRPIIEDLFYSIYKTHNIEPWKAIVKCIDKNHLRGSVFSEYEIYFNFAFARTKQVKIRHLKWANIKFNINQIANYQKQSFHYVSCHAWKG